MREPRVQRALRLTWLNVAVRDAGSTLPDEMEAVGHEWGSSSPSCEQALLQASPAASRAPALYSLLQLESYVQPQAIGRRPRDQCRRSVLGARKRNARICYLRSGAPERRSQRSDDVSRRKSQ